MGHFRIHLNTVRNSLSDLPADRLMAEARRHVKFHLARCASGTVIADTDIPDPLVNDEAVRRFLEIRPPVAAVIPEFQVIVNEIEDAYIAGLYFAALSAAGVSIERMLNLARIELHTYHARIKQLWGKGPSNAWDENIDALEYWGYLSPAFAIELKTVYAEIRNRYLHSGPISDMRADALRAVTAAYKLLELFLGFPANLFRINQGVLECLDVTDPRFRAFYAQAVEGSD